MIDQVTKDTKDLVMNLMMNNSVLNPNLDENAADGLNNVENWQEHVTQLEAYLDNFDYFTGKSKLDRQKLKFHQDYNRAKAVYHDDLILYPEINQKSSKEQDGKKKWVKLSE